jgi:hypothetical protein
MRKAHCFLIALSLYLPAVPPCGAQSAADRAADRIAAGEREFLTKIGRHRPILETYIQELSDNADPDAPPSRDHYMLLRLDFKDGVSGTPLLASAGFQKQPRLLFFRRNAALVFVPDGFAQMVVPDAFEFSRQAYDFEYVRGEFLGDVRCLVFDIAPKKRKAAGKFIGRIWVEDRDFRIVRFNGTYTASRSSSMFFHFDSWRVNVAPGFWAPAAVYVEDANAPGEGGSRFRFKAQTRLWGYNAPRGGRLDELTSILIQAEHPVQDESGARDVSPLESERSWKQQAEENVIERLENSGLLAPKGEVDQVLNTVVNNLLVTNQIPRSVQCRVMLTTPLETFSIGHTIVVSRGLLDVLPDETSLALVLSTELAHIVLAHPTETMYAFRDETMFGENEILSRLRFSRTAQENEAAGKKAMEMLSRSPYRDTSSNARLFLQALASHSRRLPNLIQPNLGNGLAGAAGLLRLAGVSSQAQPREESQSEQLAALPLGSRIRLDPWTNQIALIKTKPVALLSPKEKMPFEVAPLRIYLTRLPSGQLGKAGEAAQTR